VYGLGVTADVDSFDLFAFEFLGQRMQLAWERDAVDLAPLIDFVDDDHALSFLRAITREPRVWTILEMVRRRAPYGLAPGLLDRERLLERFARHLARRLLLVVDGRGAQRGGGGRVRPVEPPPSKPAPPQTKSTFIAIELVDEEGRPVSFERYRITLPDGSVRNGRLDEKGRARIENIRPAGACDVTFIDIHGEEWRGA
jgi:hypothetical protein